MNFKPPVEIAKTACTVAKAKTSMSVKAMLVMGFLAGAYIAFGGFLMTTVTQDVAQYAGVGVCPWTYARHRRRSRTLYGKLPYAAWYAERMRIFPGRA